MGKSSRLLKALLGGVKILRSPSKEKDKTDQAKKSTGKEKTRWSLGRSVSRNWDAGTGKAEELAGRATSQKGETGGTYTHAATSTTCDDNSESDIMIKSSSTSERRPDSYNADAAHSVNAEQWVDYHFDRAAKPTVADLSAPTAHDDEEEDTFIIKTFSPHHEQLSYDHIQQLHKTACILSHSPSKLHWAASVIQTAFRGYLARRALRALKGLVRLQALARGRMVRKQAAATLRCVHALVRVQARVRARRVRMSEEGQAVQRQIQQRQQDSEEWDNSPATPEQLQAKAQYRQVAAMKRERALAYAFSEQLRRCAPKQSSIVIDCKGDKSHWGWKWLERWMAAKPWESSFPGLAREHVSVMNVMDPSLLIINNNSSNTTNNKQVPSPPKGPSIVKRRSLSIPESMFNNLESILSPSKTTPPPNLLPSFSFGPHHITNSSSSPSSRSAALAFDASQPLLSSPFRLRLSLPTLSSLSSQKSPNNEPPGLPLSRAFNFKDCGATIDKDRIVAEALKGSLEPFKKSGLPTSKDDSYIGCTTKGKKNFELNSVFSKLGNNVEEEASGGCTTKGEKIERTFELGSVFSKVGNYERRISYEKGVTEGTKSASKRGQSIKGSEHGDGSSNGVPGYMLSTQSAKAKARQPSGNCNMSPAKKQEGSPASASKKRSSPAGSDPRLPFPSPGLEVRLPSPSSQRLISHVRTSSSRTLLDSFKEHIASEGAVTQVK